MELLIRLIYGAVVVVVVVYTAKRIFGMDGALLAAVIVVGWAVHWVRGAVGWRSLALSIVGAFLLLQLSFLVGFWPALAIAAGALGLWLGWRVLRLYRG